MSTFPQELRDLAKAKAEAQERYNVLAMQGKPSDEGERIEYTIEKELAYRAAVTTSTAFQKALDAYMAKENTAANATEAA